MEPESWKRRLLSRAARYRTRHYPQQFNPDLVRALVLTDLTPDEEAAEFTRLSLDRNTE